MQRMPQLKIVCCFGAGYEGVDLAYTREHGIALTNAPGVNDDTVADHALGLMLALARGYPQLDRAVREGRFASARDERPTLSGARLGMLGLGNIGMKIAQRAAAFGMSIAYCTRKPRPDLAWRHYADAIALAQAVDWLVVATPGGAATRHLVNAAVLQALGAKGWLVNISRGSVVDEAALIAALRDGVIAGAGLDVYADEPDINPALLALPNTVFTPHMAGRSPQAQQAQMDLLLANLQACFEGRALPSAVN
jgi:lactate dehydrogenase-like 2-hydroxyacid dehydrogenase